MMNMILTKLHRFGRIRPLHTIISQETIKPSSPTPSHLKTHNLSVIDKYVISNHIPWIFFYKNYNKGDINILKKSLSQCLTQYYPFAGRLLTTSSPHVNCNDEGVELLEASIDSRLDDFVVKKEQDETLDQLIPHSLGCSVNKTSTSSIVEVQLNHFTCGGAALAVSIAHKVADAFTMVNFINHWATVTRGETPPVKLSFSSSSSSSNSSISNYKTPEEVEVTGKVKYVTRRFLFSNSKLNDLKNKVNAMGTTPVNPTRVDALTYLLFKCALGAATTKSGSSQQSNLLQLVNLRGNMGSKFPELGAGNMIGMVNAMIADSGKIKLNDVITSLRKERMELQGARDMEEIGKKWANVIFTIGDGRSRTYFSSSICRFPLYQVDFGWGNPVRAMLRGGNQNNFFTFMDTPSGDGIEATVNLEEEEMAIFQQDKELLAYTQADDQYMI